ncbi:chondroitin AC/alginate lyase [Naematelia encephala]|uniref:Chondroitin AC/alginate lyase n=1 Tax=Naematelia encephala TaxID=71784 RepID=A0A1Y2BBV2_9TREE|nr:chondroitin AC/alginate lyase [Naematelia encephala]
MSRYQQAPYSDNPGYDNNGFGGRGNAPSGYRDEPQGQGYGYGGGSGADEYPMSSRNPYASGSSAGAGGYAVKKKRNKWLWIGLPILAIIIIGAVLGGVLGTQLNKGSSNSSNNSTSSGSSGSSGSNVNTGVPSGVTDVSSATSSFADGQNYLAVATDTYMLPVYATGTATAGYFAPTSSSSSTANTRWPDDPSPPSNSSIRDHPRLIAPGYKWTALMSGLIDNDPYLKFWNETIVNNASSTLGDDPVAYTPDGGLSGSGVLDVAREMKLRVKNWAYAYRVTNNTAYADRVWLELQTAAGNNSDVSFGADGTRWNAAHFLDLAEFCNMFAIGYDWLYDHWTDEQRDAIMWSILNLGLEFGYNALTNNAAGQAGGYAWWTGNPTMINGNWNCVCNGGLTMAALAIIDRDPTGLAQQIIDLTVPNAFGNCMQGPHSDGTWSETANYWYFGTTGAAELVSGLMTAYGNDRGLSTSNPGFALTSLFHMYVQGMTSLFNYGDHGPNKYSTTANSLMLWGSLFNEPRYALYQRDHYDAPEPYSMFWYDPSFEGTWWDNLSLDHHFNATEGEWATGRSTWASNDGTYWAMKSGALQGHQTHGDLDLGDFVLDAMGQRWFGELGSAQYLSDGYFSSEAQNSERWLYYRKRTEGQNTILIDYQNQNVNAAPSTNFGSTGTEQGPAPSLNISTDDTVFFTHDLSSAYNYTVKRGIRFLNGRRQILIQDDIDGVPTGTDVQWRAHTNATVTIGNNTATATLVLAEQTLIASILQGPSGVGFSTAEPTRTAQDPPNPSGPAGTLDDDQPNPGVTVLVVDNPNGGNHSLSILFDPQWSDFTESNYVTPPNVALDSWSLTSHN